MKLFVTPLAMLGASVALAAVPLPLHTQSRWIMDASNARVKFRCINWSGHGEPNIPEGLNKQPLEHIADFVRDQGFNCVRLTYSIDHALNPSVSVKDSFVAAAGAANLSVDVLTAQYHQVVENNPWVEGGTTQDVFARVIKTLWDREVMTVLDNHVSKASWCCGLTDGNGWWDEAKGYNSLNSRFFKTQDWLDGLGTMATWAKSQTGVVAMSLRNELRPFLLQDLDGHDDWFKFIGQGANAVHDANQDVLIIVGGSQSATDLSFIRTRNLDWSTWEGKHVWEFHAYSFTVTFPDPFDSCDLVKAEYGLLDGFLLEQDKPWTAPLFLSEFGVGLEGGPNDGLNDDNKRYFDCLKSYMVGNDADWALWALQGSYYVRDGTADYDEQWGLMKKDWSGSRNEKFREMMVEMFELTQGP